MIMVSQNDLHDRSRIFAEDKAHSSHERQRCVPRVWIDTVQEKRVWSKNPNACFLQRLQTCHRLLNVLISSLL
jgi:hypothetical protein